jgi:uncharacterized protein YjiS (DUF1127 family)
MNFSQRVKRAFAERKAMRELAALEDYVLKDIGVTRANICHAVRGR